jgi:tetrapyrrole methylase family protein/MazG family protein
MLDECYEFFDAVDGGDAGHIREELGDLLLQIVLHSQIASEEGLFSFEDVARGISDKIVFRHPHVFGDTKVSSSTEVVRNWEQLKRQEKGKQERESILDGIPRGLPALFFAEKTQRRVARVGFDWTEMKPVLDKVEEEFGEFRRAVESGDTEHAEEELGDILFALVNVARHRGVCAEDALRRTVRKFMRRFRYMERALRDEGTGPAESTLERMDELWEQSKGEVG